MPVRFADVHTVEGSTKVTDIMLEKKIDALNSKLEAAEDIRKVGLGLTFGILTIKLISLFKS